MQGNKSRDTGPELALRRSCFALGLRYRVAVAPIRGLRGSADMVFPRAKVAVYLDGCFWHGCPEHYVPPKQHAQFWADKVSMNRDRDERTSKLLHEAGWEAVRVWEHEDPAAAATRIAHVVSRRRSAS